MIIFLPRRRAVEPLCVIQARSRPGYKVSRGLVYHHSAIYLRSSSRDCGEATSNEFIDSFRLILRRV